MSADPARLDPPKYLPLGTHDRRGLTWCLSSFIQTQCGLSISQRHNPHGLTHKHEPVLHSGYCSHFCKCPPVELSSAPTQQSSSSSLTSYRHKAFTSVTSPPAPLRCPLFAWALGAPSTPLARPFFERGKPPSPDEADGHLPLPVSNTATAVVAPWIVCAGRFYLYPWCSE